jgi:hypothetical protein
MLQTSSFLFHSILYCHDVELIMYVAYIHCSYMYNNIPVFCLTFVVF